jgi:aspartyl-tRNA synthetase
VQTVISQENKFFPLAKEIKPYSVVKIVGKVQPRPAHLENPKLETGKVEVSIDEIYLLSLAKHCLLMLRPMVMKLMKL